MNYIHKLLLASVLFACSSETPAAPSRPPIPPPANTPDGGEATGDGGLSNCFDAAATKPTEPGHFLNQCSGTECFKFDSAQIEGWKPGAPLPPLN